MKKSAEKILKEAEKAGWEAYEKCVPQPMTVVEHKNPFNDRSPVKQSWHVPDGVCGFAWINVKGNSQFIRDLKKAGLASADINCFDSNVVFKKDSYYKGYTYWVRGSQSYERKMAFAHAFSDVLSKYGINSLAMGRLD